MFGPQCACSLNLALARSRPGSSAAVGWFASGWCVFKVRNEVWVLAWRSCRCGLVVTDNIDIWCSVRMYFNPRLPIQPSAAVQVEF